MRKLSVLLLLFVAMVSAQPASAAVSVGINIGINLPVFPALVVVPGYPVYYAPRIHADYFFYDGFFWVFNVADGHWYASAWYNGPWVFVQPVFVPQPILVIPFRYYQVRPIYWSGWAVDAAPRWGLHWGREWEARRAGWERWDRGRAVAVAPLPTYQRAYSRDRYPAPAQQVAIHDQHYKYQPRDAHVRQERAAIVRHEAAGGVRATAKAERVEHPAKAERAEPPRAAGKAERVEHPAKAERAEPPRVVAPDRERRHETPPRHEVQPSTQQQVAPQHAPRREPAPPPAGHQGTPQPSKEERRHEKGPEGRSEDRK